MKVRIAANDVAAYPDLMVIRGARQFYDDRRDVVTNLTLIVEVLSDSTEADDRGDKFRHYRSIASLRAYLLLSQSRVQAELFLRQPDGTWSLSSYQEELGKEKLAWLRRFAPFANGIPSHDCIAAVISRVRPKAFQSCFADWTRAVAKATDGEVVAVDGKTARGSRDRRRGKQALHMVSAWVGMTTTALRSSSAKDLYALALLTLAHSTCSRLKNH